MNESSLPEEINPPSDSETDFSGFSELAAGIDRSQFDANEAVIEVQQPLAEFRLPNPEEVLNRVVEAAEQNQAIEKLLERSHEIKDSTGYHNFTAGPTALSDLIKQKSDSIIGQTPPDSTKATNQMNWVQKMLNDNSLYAHAVRYGFVTALFSLIVALMVVWLFT